MKALTTIFNACEDVARIIMGRPSKEMVQLRADVDLLQIRLKAQELATESLLNGGTASPPKPGFLRRGDPEEYFPEIGNLTDVDQFVFGRLKKAVIGSEDSVGSTRYNCTLFFEPDDITSNIPRPHLLGFRFDFSNFSNRSVFSRLANADLTKPVKITLSRGKTVVVEQVDGDQLIALEPKEKFGRLPTDADLMTRESMIAQDIMDLNALLIEIHPEPQFRPRQHA